MAIQHVFRWDLDKTYLRSEFESVGDLVNAAFESARDKRAYPGATALLRSLGQDMDHRICIVSGSPTQMRRVLMAKLRLDGVRYDEFVLKNNLKNLVRGRFRALRSQVPYKLPTIMASRIGLGTTPPETLFGDDAEADAIIYSLYADILAGTIDADQLSRIMAAARAYDDEIEWVLSLHRQIIRNDSVKRVLIHLDKRTATGTFSHFGARLVPIFNYFQAALVLYADGVLDARQVLYVAEDMLATPEYELATLANSLQDLMRRGRISLETARRLAEDAGAVGDVLRDNPALPPFEQIAAEFRTRVRQLGSAPAPSWPDRPKIDYVSLVDTEHYERREKKRAKRRLRRARKSARKDARRDH